MPYTVNWDDTAQTIVRIDYSDPTTMKEIFAAQAEANEKIESCVEGCSLIINFGQVSKMPPNMLTQAKKLMGGTNPKAQYVAMVGRNSLATSLQSYAFKIYGAVGRKFEQKTLFAKDIDEAHRLIQENRALRNSYNISQLD